MWRYTPLSRCGFSLDETIGLVTGFVKNGLSGYVISGIALGTLAKIGPRRWGGLENEGCAKNSNISEDVLSDCKDEISKVHTFSNGG